MVFFGVKKKMSLRKQQKICFSRTSCRDIIFFLQKQCIFYGHKVLTEYFFCPFQRQNLFFNQICRQKKNFFSHQKNHSPPPPPPFKLNGCCLILKCKTKLNFGEHLNYLCQLRSIYSIYMYRHMAGLSPCTGKYSRGMFFNRRGM